jgi:hypothetical protein
LAVAAGHEDGGDEDGGGGRRGERIVRRDMRSVGRWCVGMREGGSVCSVCNMRKEVDICGQRQGLAEMEIGKVTHG